MSIGAIPSTSTTQPLTSTRQSAQTLSPDALALISKLKSRDTEVRQHEQAHLAAAGGMATSGPSYTYQRGPNGIEYAIGGEVNIDTSPGATPQETIERARTIQAAALAPAEPSGADRAVAAQAQQMEMQARQELAQQQAASDSKSGSNPDQIQRAYNASPAAPPSLDVYA